MIKKLGLYYRSLKYLKFKQIYSRGFYFLRGKKRRFTKHKYNYNLSRKGNEINLLPFPMFDNSYIAQGTFKFLNIEHQFSSIDWDYPDYGKLWTYNLNYFDYLNQKDGSVQTSKILMEQFVQHLPQLQNANEPYPISLRLINWVKFFQKNGIKEGTLSDSLYAQAKILMDKLEFHLLGNHLLENGFGLLFAAYYFQDDNIYNQAKKIIQEELEEQVLKDGGHFELSPMYHQIILLRVLDCYNLVKQNDYQQNELAEFLEDKVRMMLGWLASITFANGEIPMLNDSAYGITPDSKSLFEYASTLGIDYKGTKLSESGYRKWNVGEMEVVMDVGHIGPSYIPGHAHADSLNFVMNINNEPFLVDLGTSTYESNALRLEERGTNAHNTVSYKGRNSSEVWSSFRVGNRADTKILVDEANKLCAKHNGYQKENCIHQRTFKSVDNQSFFIEDILTGDGEGVALFHFHPSIENIAWEDGIKTDKANFKFFTKEEALISEEEISIKDYNFAIGFNKTVKAKVLEVRFKKELITLIQY